MKAEDKVHGLLLKHLPRRSDLLSVTGFRDMVTNSLAIG